MLLLALTSSLTLAHEGEGTPTALLKKLFPKAEGFVVKDFKLADAGVRSHVEKRLGAKLEAHDLTARGYVATVGGRSIGVAWNTDLHLGAKFADVLVGLDTQGQVVGVVLDHSPIPALAQPAYLAQYRGKTASSAFKIGQDLKAAPGQAGPSTQLARTVRKVVIVITEAVIPHH